MGRRTTRRTFGKRLTAVLQYEKGQASANQLAQQLGISMTTIQRWIRHYQSEGIDGLRKSHHWK